MEITYFGSQADREQDAKRRLKIHSASELGRRSIAEEVGVLCPVIEQRAALVQAIAKAGGEPRRDALPSQEFHSERRSDVQRSQTTDGS